MNVLRIVATEVCQRATASQNAVEGAFNRCRMLAATFHRGLWHAECCLAVVIICGVTWNGEMRGSGVAATYRRAANPHWALQVLCRVLCVKWLSLLRSIVPSFVVFSVGVHHSPIAVHQGHALLHWDIAVYLHVGLACVLACVCLLHALAPLFNAVGHREGVWVGLQIAGLPAPLSNAPPERHCLCFADGTHENS